MTSMHFRFQQCQKAISRTDLVTVSTRKQTNLLLTRSGYRISANTDIKRPAFMTYDGLLLQCTTRFGG